EKGSECGRGRGRIAPRRQYPWRSARRRAFHEKSSARRSRAAPSAFGTPPGSANAECHACRTARRTTAIAAQSKGRCVRGRLSGLGNSRGRSPASRFALKSGQTRARVGSSCPSRADASLSDKIRASLAAGRRRNVDLLDRLLAWRFLWLGGV